MPTKRISFQGIDFDNLSIAAVMGRLLAVTEQTRFSYLVTPNVDHIVMLNGDESLRPLYSRAAICLCDSRILRRLARFAGIRLSLIPGSDLTRLLFLHVLRPGDRIAIVGGDDPLLASLQAQYPRLQFLHFVPPMGLRTDPIARQAAVRFIATSRARFSFIAVGAPQQELIAAETLDCPDATGMALCVGASLEFLTGQQRRAPRLLQLLSLEWMHRLVANPRRLWRRYLVEDMKVVPIFVRSLNVKSWMKAAGTVSVAIGAASLAAYAWPSSPSARDPKTSSKSVLQLKLNPITINLPAPDSVRPLTPAQAGEENAERPFVHRPDKPASNFHLSDSIGSKANALTCLSQAIYYEAASEGIDGGRAVAQIVLNRVRHPAFPSTVCGVVYQGSDRATGCQFSFTCDGALMRPPITALFERSRRIAEKALAGAVFAPVGHSTHYHADYVLPYWADSLDKTVQIGRHIFYRLRGSLGDAQLFRKAYGGDDVLPQPPSLAQTLTIPPAAVAKSVSEIVADEVARQTEVPAQVVASAVKPLADTENGKLLIDGLLAPQPSTSRKSVTCSQAPDNKQIKSLRAELFQPGLTPQPC